VLYIKARSFTPARRAQALLGDHRRLAGEQRLSVMTSPRAVQAIGQTLAVPVLGGLHHQYVRARCLRDAPAEWTRQYVMLDLSI
jgi:hypothetical protein